MTERLIPEQERREKWEFSAATMAADRHPNHNEDAYFMLSENGRSGVFDGVSMASGGELAAEFARGVVVRQLEAAPVSSSVEEEAKKLTEALLAAHHYNVEYGNRHQRDLETTATVIGIVRQGDKTFAVGVQVGDTRFSLIRGEKLKIITIDDSLSVLAMAGPNEAEQRRYQDIYANFKNREELKAIGWDPETFITRNSVILQALGSRDATPVIRVYVQELQPGDVIILSSDGLHDNLTSDEMVQHSASATELVGAAKARSREGRDKSFRSKDDDVTAVRIAS